MQKSKILIDKDSPLDSEDSHDKNGSIVKTGKFPDEVKESESKMTLDGSDANEIIA